MLFLLLEKQIKSVDFEAHVIVIANFYNTSPDLIFFRQFYSAIYVVGVVGKNFWILYIQNNLLAGKLISNW